MGWGFGEGRGEPPLTSCKSVWGSVVSSPSEVWGESPAAKRILVYFQLEKSHLAATFSSFILAEKVEMVHFERNAAIGVPNN